MIVKSDINDWQHKGHVYGECMSKEGVNLMYVYIPKNASSWTKPNLSDWGWEFTNYRTKMLHKDALIVLRDPVDRWLSGIAEYFTSHHKDMNTGHFTQSVFDLVFDRVTFDDHTEKQIKFIDGLNTDRCTFMMCDKNYRKNFSDFIKTHCGDNKYDRYNYQNVSEDSPQRRQFKMLFNEAILDQPKYLQRIKDHFEEDYRLIEQVQFYGTR